AIAEKPLHALNPQAGIARPLHAVRPHAVDILLAPPVAGAREQGAARLAEAQEERLAVVAEAGMPVDEGDLLGASEMLLHDRLERAVGPFAVLAAIHQPVLVPVLTARQG